MAQFQPGVSGNPGGRPKTKPFRDALLRLIANAGNDKEKLDLVALALFTKACEGDVAAINQLADRIDGKVPQGIENGEDGPFQLETIQRVIVKPSADSDR